MNKLGIYAAAVLLVFLAGFGMGWHQKTVRVNAAIVKQVVKAAKVDAKNESQIEVQNVGDKTKIAKLEDDLAAARRDAAARSVPKLAQCRRVSQTQGDAGPREEAHTTGEPAGGGEAGAAEVRAYQELRDHILVSAAVAEQLRLQVLACQAQWPH